MTDVTVADAGGAPPAAPNEVAIDTNPVHAPAPVGSQAPDKPLGEAGARRDAVERAFARANDPQHQKVPARHPEPPKQAEAKAGHNNPPEPTEKFDLKKPPPKAEERPRGDGGRFAPRQAQEAQTGAQNSANVAQNAQQPAQHQYQSMPANTPYREPPQRMSERAKADWHATPETVRGDMHRMHQEFAAAHQRYRADHDTMNSIRPFAQMAAQHGTTLQQALGNYVGMEQKLRNDVVGGLDQIVNNLGLTHQGQPIGLRDIAYFVLSQSPEQLRMLQQGNAQSAAGKQIGALHQELSGLKNHLAQMHQQQRFMYTRSAVDQYASAHPRFDELGDLIHNEIRLGYDLDTAYRRAELLRPGTQAAQTRTTPAQTRTADKSIHGAPAAGSSGARPREKSSNPRDAVEKAMSRLNGSL